MQAGGRAGVRGSPAIPAGDGEEWEGGNEMWKVQWRNHIFGRNSPRRAFRNISIMCLTKREV